MPSHFCSFHSPLQYTSPFPLSGIQIRTPHSIHPIPSAFSILSKEAFIELSLEYVTNHKAAGKLSMKML